MFDLIKEFLLELIIVSLILMTVVYFILLYKKGETDKLKSRLITMGITILVLIIGMLVLDHFLII